jgi:hypothetical protein
MNDNNLKKLDLKKILLKVLLLAVIITALFFYFRILVIRGIDFEDTFLKKNIISSSEIKYTGVNAYGDISVIVKEVKPGTTKVIYELPGNFKEEYTLEFSNHADVYADNWVVIKQDNNIIFEGIYIRESSFLMYEDGNPYLNEEASVQSVRGEVSPYDSNYIIPLKNVANIARFAYETIWGRIEFLIFAIILFGVTVFDKRHPLFFFKLKHLLDVTNPEPTDIYLFCQKVTWYIYPIIGIGLMLYSLVWRFV